MIVLDEPTSGLDSAAAAAIVALLDDIAQKCEAAVICTIHQPSALVFAGFHKVLVLSEGRVAFCGERAAMAPYFESIGHALSHDANPAEAVPRPRVEGCHFRRGGHADPRQVGGFRRFEERRPGVWRRRGQTSHLWPGRGRRVAASAFHVFKATGVPLARGSAPVHRTTGGGPPDRRLLRSGVSRVQGKAKQVPFGLFYLWWVLALPACMSISTLIGTNRDNMSVVYEIRAGMYKAWSYAMSTSPSCRFPPSSCSRSASTSRLSPSAAGRGTTSSPSRSASRAVDGV